MCISFQVNTGAAEVLYSTVGEWAQLDQDSTVLDVCCGTGTIGISLAKVILVFHICNENILSLVHPKVCFNIVWTIYLVEDVTNYMLKRVQQVSDVSFVF